MPLPLSLLDLAIVAPGETTADAFEGSVALARTAEVAGYTRVWYAEHHNNPTIASSATAVLIAHVASATSSIRLGAGGVMLPNHAPLTIAEQYGTLATLHPGRIDLGLGRAPGTDRTTMHALRRPMGPDTFPDDVRELQGYLGTSTLVPGVQAYPGYGTDVPLYILGSSLFGARLAASYGLPYAFASHFAPQHLQEAVSVYRAEFQPSEQLAEPYVIAGVGAVAAETEADAHQQLAEAQRRRLKMMAARGRELSDAEADAVLASPQGQGILEMMAYTAVGTREQVGEYLEAFAKHAQADELIVALHSSTTEDRLRSAQILAESVA